MNKKNQKIEVKELLLSKMSKIEIETEVEV